MGEPEMSSMDNRTEPMELDTDDMEKVSGGSWLGNIWNKIKSFGGSVRTDITVDGTKA